MFSGDSYFGLNLATLAGLLLTALGLSFARMRPGRRRFGIGMMAVGTALVLLGFWLGSRPL